MCSQVINNTLTKTKDFAKQKMTQNQQLTDQNRDLAAQNIARQMAHQVYAQQTQQEINELAQQYNEAANDYNELHDKFNELYNKFDKLIDDHDKLKVQARRYMSTIPKSWQHLTYEQLKEFHEQYSYEELLGFKEKAEQAEAEIKRLNEQLIKAKEAARKNISTRLHKQ